MSGKVAVIACILILATAVAFSEVCTVHVWVEMPGPKWIAAIDYGNGNIEKKEVGKGSFGALTDFIVFMEEQGWKLEFYSAAVANHFFIFRK